jgi:hypothetical protein
MQDNALSGTPAGSRPTCGVPDCGTKLYIDNRIGFCGPHRYANSRTGPRFCSGDGCGGRLDVRNRSGLCPACTAVKVNADRRAATVTGRSQWRMCAAENCEKRIGPTNKSGRCHEHKWAPVLISERGACPIDGCGKRLSKKNTIGRCQKHSLPRWVAAVCAAGDCAKMLNVNNLTGFCGEHTNGYRRDVVLRRNYGISEAEYDAMLAAQNGGCALCGSPPKPGGTGAASRLHVDHDHVTKRVRALLCTRCNIGIGHFCENPALMRAAADYVELYVALHARATREEAGQLF